MLEEVPYDKYLIDFGWLDALGWLAEWLVDWLAGWPGVGLLLIGRLAGWLAC